MNHPQHEKLRLFTHTPHPHEAVDVNAAHREELTAASVNKKIAVGMTRVFQSMWTFWGILTWLILWIVCSLIVPRFFDPLPWPLMLTLASVPQLPLMVVIMVGQGLLGRKQELQAEEQFNTTQKIFHDVEQLMQHLAVQDSELLKQSKELDTQTGMLVAIAEVLIKAAEKRNAE